MNFWPGSASRPSALEQEASCPASFSLEDPVWPTQSEPFSVGQGAVPALEGLILPFFHSHPGHHRPLQMKRMTMTKRTMNQKMMMTMMMSCLILRPSVTAHAEDTKG